MMRCASAPHRTWHWDSDSGDSAGPCYGTEQAYIGASGSAKKMQVCDEEKRQGLSVRSWKSEKMTRTFPWGTPTQGFYTQ